ncbi:class IV adenylate cyclase [Desulfatiferula olefinivorans]
MNDLEIEIKAWCPDLAPVRDILKTLGAVYRNTCREEDRYYNHPARDFSRTDEALRLRRVGETVTLTYKGPKLSRASKARVEKETGVDNGDEASDILELLGFKASGTVTKTREGFDLNGITVCLDQVDGLGSFVELEKKGDDLEAVEQELLTLAGRIGLDRFERRSYLELILG